MLIFILGYMGSGKTTFGKELADRLTYRFYDLDELIEQQEKKSISSIFNELSEEGFRKIERKILLEHLDDQDAVIATGGGTPCFFDNMDLMNQKGITVFLDIEVEEIFERINKDENIRPLLNNMAENERFSFITRHLEERKFYYNLAKIILRSDDPEEFKYVLRNYPDT